MAPVEFVVINRLLGFEVVELVVVIKMGLVLVVVELVLARVEVLVLLERRQDALKII